MKNRSAFALIFVVVFVLLAATMVSAQRLIDGGSVGVRAREVAQAVLVALTSLVVAWLSRG